METRNRHAKDALTVRRALFLIYLAACTFALFFLIVISAT